MKEMMTQNGYNKSLQGLTDEQRRAVESKVNGELKQLQNAMERSRCKSCGFTGYEHQEWCPRRK